MFLNYNLCQRRTQRRENNGDVQMQTQHLSTSHCFSLTSPTTWIITNSEQIRYGPAVDIWGKNACGQVLRGSHCNSWNGIADLNLRMNRSSKTFLLLVLSSPADHILGFCEDMGLFALLSFSDGLPHTAYTQGFRRLC